MGLDMYLTGNMYLSKYTNEKLQSDISVFFNEKIGEVKGVEFEVMYWRKANAIHKWFVDNVQDGIDDCGTYGVAKSDLNELRNALKSALDNKDKASELLPTQGGFFFGGTDIDEWYFKSIQETYERIDFILTHEDIFEDIQFEYTSSW